MSIDCAGVKHAPSGVRLRRRERVSLLVPRDFPFAYPRVRTLHRRFAGVPHVQWGTTLCLYQSPATEWDPADGMFGFLHRLLTWLTRAASGELDPARQALHPPVAYTSRDAGCLVVRADAPRADAAAWLGAAVLRRVSDARADVVGWLGIDEEWPTSPQAAHGLVPPAPPMQDGAGLPVFLALTIVLPDPIAFEMPDTAAALAAALATQGVLHNRFLGLLGLVASYNELLSCQLSDTEPANTGGAGENDRRTFPLYVFVGTPSRGIASIGDLLTHLVAWRLPDIGEQIASLLIYQHSTSPQLAEIGARVMDLAADWLSRAGTQWARVFEERAEIVTRRDAHSPASWLIGKHVLVLGCGALGAPIAEHCARAGAAQLTIADKGTVHPGILVRQPYDDADIGRNKALALADRLRRIRPDLPAIPVAEDVRAHLIADTADAPAVDLVIDATANRTVALQIERHRAAQRDSWPALLSVLIGFHAERGIATLALPAASGGGADILRRLGLHARANATGNLADVVADFFPYPPRTEFFQPEPGCSEATFIGSATDVTALASQLFTGSLRILAAYTAGQPVDPMSALIVRLLGDLDAPSRPPVRLSWRNDVILHEAAYGYEVRLTTSAVAQMRAEARRGARVRDRTIETGGMLLGAINDACRVIWVDTATGPPPDSRLSSAHFQHGLAGIEQLLDHHSKTSGTATQFIGMWHTHPDGRAWPSPTDEQGMRDLLVPVMRAPRRALLLILGGKPDRWSAWLDSGVMPDAFVRLISRAPSNAQPSDKHLVVSLNGPWWPGGYALYRGDRLQQEAKTATTPRRARR
jgi:integrative and conjugative element protein (TIGR02256 family)